MSDVIPSCNLSFPKANYFTPLAGIMKNKTRFGVVVHSPDAFQYRCLKNTLQPFQVEVS